MRRGFCGSRSRRMESLVALVVVGGVAVGLAFTGCGGDDAGRDGETARRYVETPPVAAETPPAEAEVAVPATEEPDWALAPARPSMTTSYWEAGCRPVSWI